MKVPTKSTVETVKTVVIAVLVTGILAFIAGMIYEKSLQTHVEAKVQAVTAKAPAKN